MNAVSALASETCHNPSAFDPHVQDLVLWSIPILKELDQVYGGKQPEITPEESLQVGQ